MDTLRNQKTKLAAANKDILGFIGSFIDDKSFVETDAFMCSENDVADAPGEGVVSGFATVKDTPVCLFATNPAVLKGSVGALNAKKITRTINNAVRMDKPLIAVWDSAGARFAEGIECLEAYASILRAYTVAYGEVPVITLIKGNNFGLSSYVAGLSDFVIVCKDGKSATASPLVISAKTGNTAVGTADDLMSRGIATNKCDSLRDTIVKMLGVFYGVATGDDPNRVCKGLKAGVSASAVIKEVFDKNSFFALRDGYTKEVITGFASLADVSVGVVAIDSSSDGGRLTADGCIKISEFLNTCENAEVPVVFLVDSVGTEINADDAAVMREMSNLIYRVNTLDSDIFSVVTGKAIGSAYTSLVAPAEYKIAWDTAEVGTLESEAAARLLYADEIKSAKNKDKAAQKLAAAYSEENCSALTIARSGYFDNVIEPNHTRSYLVAALLAHVE
ncbi:MAG: hypothetical protein J1F33_00735 [Clostridiales bacterium]|nr:hypothetical protein [Clostridiales bacterium]